MRSVKHGRSASTSWSAFAGFRFPPEVIVLAVRWYLRFGLSNRDAEELLAGRGIIVDHVTISPWGQRFTALLAEAARRSRRRVGDRWYVDEDIRGGRRRGALRSPLPGTRWCRICAAAATT
jgi:IS6 family transposase